MRSPLRVTVPRTRVLSALVSYVHLTTAQFYALFGATTESSQRALRRVLRDFTGLGFLRRARLMLGAGTRDQLPSWEFLYWLSSRGILSAREADLDPYGVARAADERSPFMLAHEHEITSFHLRLDQEARKEVWWRQTGIKHDFPTNGTRSAVSPDALFYFDGYYYFLEIERSKHGHYRKGESGLMRKLANYVSYFRSGAFKDKWPGMEGFYALVVVRSEERRRNLLAAAARKFPYPLFKVTTEDRCREAILGPIWRSPSGAVTRLGGDVQ